MNRGKTERPGKGLRTGRQGKERNEQGKDRNDQEKD